MHLTYIVVFMKTFCGCLWFSPSTWAGEFLAHSLPVLAKPVSSQRSSLLPGSGLLMQEMMDADAAAGVGRGFLLSWVWRRGDPESKLKCFAAIKVCPIPNSSECFLRFGVCVGLLATVVWPHRGVCFAQEKNQELFYGGLDSFTSSLETGLRND